MNWLEFREPFSAWSHAAWMLLSLPATYLLWRLARGDRLKQLGLVVFGSSLTACFAASVLYHGLRLPEARMEWYATLDYVGVHLLIAGTITPLALVVLRGRWRSWSLGVTWLLAGVGIGLRLWGVPMSRLLSNGLYLGMGWTVLLCYFELARTISHRAVLPALVGGLVYSVGAILNHVEWPSLWPGVFSAHELWHLFVMAGSLSHFWLMLTVVVPFQRRKVIECQTERLVMTAATVSDSNLAQRPNWSRLNWSNIIYWAILQIGVVLAPFFFSWTAVAVGVVLYFVTALGITMGYHRLLTHRSFQTPKIVEYILVMLGSLANQGGPLRWVATHRVHHQHSDEPGDPHSPRDGVWWSHLLWWMPHSPILDHPEFYKRFVIDLSRDRYYRFLQNWSVLPPVTLAALIFAVGEWWSGEGLAWLVWGVFVRTTLLYHATWFINSAAHVWGYRNHETNDRSTNVWWLAICSLGEGWHNNHHTYPRSARHGLCWWEIDLTYLAIRFMGLLGLARHIHVPGKILKQVTRVTSEDLAIGNDHA